MASIGGRDCITLAPVSSTFSEEEVGAPGDCTWAGVLLAPQPVNNRLNAATGQSLNIVSSFNVKKGNLSSVLSCL